MIWRLGSRYKYKYDDRVFKLVAGSIDETLEFEHRANSYEQHKITMPCHLAQDSFEPVEMEEK